MVGSLKCALLPEHRCALKLLMSLFSFLPVSQDGAAAEGGDGPENSQDLTVFVSSLICVACWANSTELIRVANQFSGPKFAAADGTRGCL